MQNMECNVHMDLIEKEGGVRGELSLESPKGKSPKARRSGLSTDWEVRKQNLSTGNLGHSLTSLWCRGVAGEDLAMKGPVKVLSRCAGIFQMGEIWTWFTVQGKRPIETEGRWWDRSPESER